MDMIAVLKLVNHHAYNEDYNNQGPGKPEGTFKSAIKGRQTPAPPKSQKSVLHDPGSSPETHTGLNM
uniref:Uncharacterized protein n=1 Tax=Timema tahoe TaxID=61484 RepID=A0A7R9NX76_9NEOP|nr:unnamed protein product [Timema tahoe]